MWADEFSSLTIGVVDEKVTKNLGQAPSRRIDAVVVHVGGAPPVVSLASEDGRVVSWISCLEGSVSDEFNEVERHATVVAPQGVAQSPINVAVAQCCDVSNCLVDQFGCCV